MSRSSRKDQRARRLQFENLEERRVLTTVTVSTAVDVVDAPDLSSVANLISSPGADGKISLREAIEAANFDITSNSDTIQFASNLDNATITLIAGELGITDSVKIDAHLLTSGLTINAGGNGADDGFTSRIFSITDPTGGTAPPLVKLIDLTLTGGDTGGNGGAIDSAASLELDGCTIKDNFSSGSGGAISLQGSSGDHLSLSILANSVISGNTARGYGGGVYTWAYGAQVHLADSTVTGNTSFNDGGGAYVRVAAGASLLVEHSTVSNNTAGGASSGGGLFVKGFPNASSISIKSNSIISGYTAATGGDNNASFALAA